MNLFAAPGLRFWALLSAAWVSAMLALFVITGIGQEPLQAVHPAADYAQLLLRNPPVLRATLGLDNLFILSYCTVFVLLASVLWRDGAPRLPLALGLALLLAVGVLDSVENLHLLVMLAAAEQGHPPDEGQIGWQALESMLKFHLSYLGLLLLGLALPRERRLPRALARLLVGVQAPVGVAIYVLPRALAVPLVFARFAFFLAALALVAAAWGRTDRSAGRDAGV